MDKTILVGLLSVLGLLAASLLTLAGVLYTTRTNWKLGTRNADTAAAATATTAQAAAQAADATRIAELAGENKGLRESEGKLRAEITEMWAAIGKLRRETESEIQSLKDECRHLREEAGEVPALKGAILRHEATILRNEATILRNEATIQAQEVSIKAKDEKIADLNTMLNAASSGQQLAEGIARQSAAQADRLITTLLPSKDER